MGLGPGAPRRRSRNMAGPAELVRASVRGPRGRCWSAAAGPGGVGRDGGAPAAARSRRHPRGVRGHRRVATDPLRLGLSEVHRTRQRWVKARREIAL